MESMNRKKVIAYAGSFIAFLIGSGFATGQEIMQYFASYGYQGLVVAFLVFILLAFVGTRFIITGFKQRFKQGNEIYSYYCGERLGLFFDYFSVFFLYLSFLVMIGGSAATLKQQFGFHPAFGACLMGIAAACTVIFGLNKIVKVLGNLGPVIIVLVLLLGIAGIVKSPTNLIALKQILPNVKLLKASERGVIFSAASYVGFSMLWLAAFMTSLGKSATSAKEGAYGALLGAALFSLTIVINMLGLLANVQEVEGSQVPNLVLANLISPYIGSFFSIVVLLGIYTTAVPLLWSVSVRLVEETSPRYKKITITLATIGVFIGLGIPFDRLVHLIYVFNGYVGVVLLCVMLYRDGWLFIKNKKNFKANN